MTPLSSVGKETVFCATATVARNSPRMAAKSIRTRQMYHSGCEAWSKFVVSSGYDGNHAQHRKSESCIARNFALVSCGCEIDAFGENPPGNFLRDDGFGGAPILFAFRERPRAIFAAQIPTAPALAGNCYAHNASRRRGDAPILKRQGAQKTIEHGIVKFARKDARSRPFDGQANLLLMVPPFGVFASRVKPVRRFFFAGPAHPIRRFCQRISPRVVLRKLLTGHFH